MAVISNVFEKQIECNGVFEKQIECNGNDETQSFSIVEPSEQYAADRRRSMTETLARFHDHLAERTAHFLGYQINLECDHFVDLYPFLRFHINNVGDPFKDSNLGLHSKKFEVEVLDWFSALWEIEKDEYSGYITNGGTEGNLQGLLKGRELLPDAILYTSKESHYSIFKIARMCRMEVNIIATLTTGEMDCEDLREKLSLNKERPAIINVNIGTTFKGGIDNLDLVIKILHDCEYSNDRFYIHCDAALHGLMVPFIEKASKISFRKQIDSIAVSGHKFLGSPMPCGVYMTRKRDNAIFTSNVVDYINTVDSTISGSRNGHTPIFMWYSLNIKGRIGLRHDTNKCLMNARHLRDRLRTAGISVMLNEMGITVVFERPRETEFISRWQLSHSGNLAHVVVMPHVTVNMLDDFVEEFVGWRRVWYGGGSGHPPCLAAELGIPNCGCSVHGGHSDGSICQV